MNEQEIQDLLKDALYSAGESEWVELGAVESIRSFEESGVLTDNKGLVITLTDGSEFQLTIVKSR